ALVPIAQARGTRGALTATRAAGLQTRESDIRVIVEASRPSLAAGSITALGGVVEARARSLLQARVPPSVLLDLAQWPGVEQVRPPALQQPQDVDEAVASTRADLWHAAGRTGAGVKVAIIDEGFANVNPANPTIGGTSVTLVQNGCDTTDST